jgi:hypothetical protein
MLCTCSWGKIEPEGHEHVDLGELDSMSKGFTLIALKFRPEGTMKRNTFLLYKEIRAGLNL